MKETDKICNEKNQHSEQVHRVAKRFSRMNVLHRMGMNQMCAQRCRWCALPVVYISMLSLSRLLRKCMPSIHVARSVLHNSETETHKKKKQPARCTFFSLLPELLFCNRKIFRKFFDVIESIMMTCYVLKSRKMYLM